MQQQFHHHLLDSRKSWDDSAEHYPALLIIVKTIDDDDGEFPLRSCFDPELGIARMLLIPDAENVAEAVSAANEIEMRADRSTRKDR